MQDTKPDSIGYWISILYRYSNIYLDKMSKPFNLGAGQIKLLHTLYQNNGLTQIELAHMFRLDRGTITRSIKKLEKAGFVQRARSNDDNRIYTLILTEKGLKIKRRLYTVLSRWTNILAKDFPEEEKKVIIIYLTRMAENAESYLRSIGIDKAR